MRKYSDKELIFTVLKTINDYFLSQNHSRIFYFQEEAFNILYIIQILQYFVTKNNS
jgi:hypothetical protein